MTNVSTKKASLTLMWQVSLAFVISAAVIMLPDMANAGGTNTPIGNILCTISDWATGNTGKGLATIAITIIGIGALLGKVSWGMAIIVALGIALVFGASTLVDAFNIPGMSDGCATDAQWPSATGGTDTGTDTEGE